MNGSTRPVALITGASAGLGRTFAMQLAKLGYDLILVARDVTRLQEVAESVAAQHEVSAEVLPADLTRDEDVARIVSRIDNGPLDLLVNNAGFGTRGSLAKTPRETQEAMIRVHVLAAHRLAQAAVQGMVARGRGAIINVSSIASWLTSPGNVNYSATKAWQRIFVESLALEVEDRGVYVQALCPGYTHTEFHQRGGMDKHRIPGWWWLSADRVVADSLRAMQQQRPVVVVPGWGYKIAVLIIRYLPRWGWRLILRARRVTSRSGAPAA
jgi:short-subunit dehydrogenase